MTTHPTRPRRGRWALVAVAAVAIVFTIGVANAVTLTRDAGALRRALVDVEGLDATLQLQGSVGRVLCSTVRTGLSFWNEVPDEAREALGAIRTASVAVYRLGEAPRTAVRENLRRSAVAAMTRRGWTAAVQVQEGADTVLIFTKPQRGGLFRVCVAVCSERDLVVGEARLATEPLVRLAAAHVPDVPGLRAFASSR